MMRLSYKQSDHKRLQISQIINAIRVIKSADRRLSRSLFEAHKITGQQLGALRIISQSPGISLGELGERLYLHISTTSGIVDRLERRQYLVRERSGADRRVVHLSITPLGQQIIRKVPLTGFGMLLRDIEHLPPDEVRSIWSAMMTLVRLMNMEDELTAAEKHARKTNNSTRQVKGKSENGRSIE